MNVSTNTIQGARRLPWWVILLGLAIAYSPNYLNRIARWLGAEWHWMGGPQSVLVWNWAVMLVLLLFILVVERRGLSSIGLRKPTGKDIQWAMIFWGVSVGVSGVVHTWFPAPELDGLEVILAFSIPVLLLIILTTSVTEEVFYRGYSIERIRELTGSLSLAVLISFVLFLLPHIAFFGPHWLLSQGLSVVLLYVLYVWRRNLWACMLMHLLGNMMILFPALGLE
ncbi:MAG: CPBP family intramembrane metalloprotease [Natronospirillum sp.]|uniref:CPBP family intramembrane glutamic endopeptidase n=1 Tax=Natronospirillum sp. TaxID=2812955 RepID=UPI0025D763C1|nr:CPBP family intramembrane glutamic endopeptidase [Natronospirillum sp.]MCH8552222.1 CPBP family intramembrane metalloprotease [Natronospirillum sp.]